MKVIIGRAVVRCCFVALVRLAVFVLADFILAIFDGRDFISKFSCDFVLFFVDGLPHLILELLEPKLAFRGPVQILRDFAGMASGSMDIDQERFEVFLEGDVVVRATEPAAFPELGKGDTAHRALFFVGGCQVICGLLQFELFGQHVGQRRRRVRRAVLIEEGPGVLFAQMEDGGTVGVGQFRDVECRRFFAVLALHRQKIFYRFAVPSWAVSISVWDQSGDAVGRTKQGTIGRKNWNECISQF